MKTFLDLLGSPRFWAAVLALAFILAKAFIPTLPLDEAEVTAAVLALVGFIAAISVQGSPTVWADLFKQGKFWILVANLAFVFIRAFWAACPISQEQVIAIIVALTGASVGTSYRPIGQPS